VDEVHNTCLLAIFQHSVVKPVPDVSILDFIGVKDDGGSDDSWRYYVQTAELQSNH